MAVVADRPAEALRGLVDPVLDRVLVQHQPFGGRLVAPAGVEEHQQGLAQPGVVLVVGGEPPQRAPHPGPQQVPRPQHHRHRRDLGVGHHPGRGSARQRDRLGGEGLLVGEAEPADALDRVAERDMDAGVRVARGRVEPVPDPEREPGPGARFVAGQEDRVGADRRLRGDVADRPLKPGDVVDRDRLVARPAHHAHVVLAQPVAQRRLGRAHVDPLARQQVTDAPRPGGAAVPQPVLPLLGVGGDHLLGDLVDVPGYQRGRALHGRGDRLGVDRALGQLPEQPVGEAGVPEPVGAQQRGQRGAALGQAARVLHRRGRGPHRGQVDLVLQDLQAGTHVAVDAGGEQRDDRLVVVAAAGSPAGSACRRPATPRPPGGSPPSRPRPPGLPRPGDPCPPAKHLPSGCRSPKPAYAPVSPSAGTLSSSDPGEAGAPPVCRPNENQHPLSRTVRCFAADRPRACARGTTPGPWFVTGDQWKNARRGLRSADNER